MDFKKKGYSTKCIHSGNFFDDITGGAIAPVHYSTANTTDKNTGKVFYPRFLNMPLQVALSKKIAVIESGEDALLFGSGMAAISTALFAVLKAGDHVVFSHDLYRGTIFLVVSEFKDMGIEFSFASSNKIDDIEKEIKENTKLIFFETPSYPLFNVIDIRAVADLAKKHGIITAIDNTFASPINQNPIKFGVDIVIHSGTKYLNGHSDLICGVIVSSAAIISRLKPYAINHGATLNVQSCSILDRGIKTLAIRVREQNKNALELASFLEQHKMVSKVYYPGLETHPDHLIAKKQMSGYGGMFSFELNYDTAKVKQVISRLNIIKELGSLGGVESTIRIPAETSHAELSPEQRIKAGISDSLLRISAGIEDIDDLIEDLDQALDV